MNNKYIRLALVLLPILASIICIVQMVKSNNQAILPVPMECAFIGQYSYDGENWYPYSESSDISSVEGDIIFKGDLDSEIYEGALLNFFCNHIGVSIYVNGELIYMDTPTEIKNYGIELMPSMCGKCWEQTLLPAITAEDEIEFRFVNYHKYGNENAYKEAISSLLITPPDNTILEAYLEQYIDPFEKAGYGTLIVAVMLLGASLASFVLKSSMTKRLFKIGITTMFAGGYIIFDVMTTFFMGELLVVKTYGSQLCLMLTIYFIGIMISDVLSDKCRKVAKIIMGLSCIINVIIIVLATIGKVLIYDTVFYWELVQYIISIVLIILCVLELRRNKSHKAELIIFIFISVAIIIDMIGVGYSMYFYGICFKVSYIIMMMLFLLFGTKQIILDHQASIKNKKLKEELENSRISVMLSQIQPHFLYNSLTSVMDLCDREPKQAKVAIADFADYLRGNLSSLKTENLISFRTELEHIEKYLKLEKLRFLDELEVVYDIQVQDFMLPTLSVQPLIENAVKHGVGQKIGGGTVTIHTSENDEEYIIRVIDNGVGFAEGEYADDEGTHIGIENTNRRLKMMANARLEIESKKGEGTTASIFIPKRRD